MNNALYAQDYSELKSAALSLIGDLHGIKKDLDALREEVSKMGIQLEGLPENATEMQFLQALALHASEQEHKQRALDDMSEIKITMEQGPMPKRPRSWIGRKLQRIVALAG